MEGKKLFFAARIPKKIAEEIFQKISGKIDRRKFSVVQPQKMHLTLLFLGNTEKTREEKAKKALDEIKAKKFEIILCGTGSFGQRILWLSAQKGAKELEEINRQLAEKLGSKNEKFHAHLTLARSRNAGKAEFEKIAMELEKEKKSWSFAVEKIELIESQQIKGRTEYISLKEKNLG